MRKQGGRRRRDRYLSWWGVRVRRRGRVNDLRPPVATWQRSGLGGDFRDGPPDSLFAVPIDGTGDPMSHRSDAAELMVS